MWEDKDYQARSAWTWTSLLSNGAGQPDGGLWAMGMSRWTRTGCERAAGS